MLRVKSRWLTLMCAGILACLCVGVIPALAGESNVEGVGSRAVPSTSVSTIPIITTPSAGGVQADTIYVSVTGAKQGKFKGEIARKGYENKIMALTFDYGVMRKPDAVTGVPTGQRQHRPIKITKTWGAASPQLFSALTINELLPTVVIDFVVINPTTSAEVLDHTITLTNAVAVSLQYQMQNVNGQYTQVEEVEFTFQKIVMTDAKSQGVAADDWSAVPY